MIILKYQFSVITEYAMANEKVHIQLYYRLRNVILVLNTMFPTCLRDK